MSSRERFAVRLGIYQIERIPPTNRLQSPRILLILTCSLTVQIGLECMITSKVSPSRPRLPANQRLHVIPAFDRLVTSISNNGLCVLYISYHERSVILVPYDYVHSAAAPTLACSMTAGACCVGIRTSVCGKGGPSSAFSSVYSSSSLGLGSFAFRC